MKLTFKTAIGFAKYIWSGDDTVFDNMIGEKDMPFIKENNNRFELFDSNGEFVKSYSRRRDAVRGGNRLGLKVA